MNSQEEKLLAIVGLIVAFLFCWCIMSCLCNCLRRLCCCSSSYGMQQQQQRHQYTEISNEGRAVVHRTYVTTTQTPNPNRPRPLRNMLWATCCFECCCRDNADFDCCTMCCPLTVLECCCP
jgi:hypothetical protein